ncbi:MAG TPA: RNA polymerase sigma factor [Verrucomicrobiae bacterium]|nr:RNA polymerase sigma factor [Verrucomicrobiae bacterium]
MPAPVKCDDPVAAPEMATTPSAASTPGPWQALYEQHSRYVYYLALRTVGDPTLAEDITHDVFLKAYRHLDQFRGQAGLRTWLYRITINHCQNTQRAWQKRSIISTGDPQALDAVAANTDSPLRVLEIKELGERIQKTLEALPDEYRLLLLLVADENLSYQEVASLTEQSSDAVRGKLHRARRAFTLEFQKNS